MLLGQQFRAEQGECEFLLHKVHGSRLAIFLHKELLFILSLQCRADPTELEFCFWLKITCFREQLRTLVM